MGSRRKVLAGAGITLGVGLGLAPNAQAAVDTFTVDLDDDPAPSGGCTTGGCTLREAITAADDGDTVDQDKIIFNSSLTGSVITLGSNLPYLDEPLWIQGLGAGNLTVSGNGHRLLFFQTPGAAELKVSDITLADAAGLDGPAINANDSNLSTPGAPSITVQDSTLTGNDSSGAGGAIRSSLAGSINIQGSTISDNAASATYGGGGGIYARLETGESVMIQDSTIEGNHTGGNQAPGGGVFTLYTPVTIQGSTISGNYATGDLAQGGGLYTRGAAITIEDSNVEGNQAYAPGGGVSAYSPYGESALTIEESTISGNTTSGDTAFGGGAYAFGSTTAIRGSAITDNGTGGIDAGGAGLTIFRGEDTAIERSTISGNHTDGAQSYGGGVYSSAGAAPGTLSISNSTVADNQAGASGYGGGIRSDGLDTAPILTNSIVADNAAGAGGPDLSRTTPFQASFSLIEDPSGASVDATVPGTNILGVDPELQPLALNGGLNGTETQALAATSPAIDCGASAGATTDQRGLTRPVDLPGRTNPSAPGADGADIGAFEVQLPETGSGACTNNAPPPPPPSGGAGGGAGSAPAAPTGQRAAALKRCKKKFRHNAKKLRKCKRKAKRLPL